MMKNKILILVPDLNGPGGVSNYCRVLRKYFSENAEYFIRNVNGCPENKSFLSKCFDQFSNISRYLFRLLKGDINNEKVKIFFKRSNVFVLHSEEESQGIVFCEAMACGKPIVATNVGGVPYVVKNGENGYLSNYTDIRQFSENIITIIHNDSLRNKFSVNNRETAKQYSWNIITDKIIEIYNKLLN